MSRPKISDRELWSCAQHYIHMRADELHDQGDVEGANTVIAIVRRIETLLNPPEGALH